MIEDMDTTIRNLNEGQYRALKARAALAGKTIGEVINDAIGSYLRRPDPFRQTGSLRDLKPRPYPEGTEHLGEEIDRETYDV